jgi:hypothetical protein
MLSRVQLSRRTHPLTTPAIGEPCLALIRNDTAFGLLIADGATWQSDAGLILERPHWFRAGNADWTTTSLGHVALRLGRQGIWTAIDIASDLLLPQPSRQPYHVIFIAEDEHHALITALTSRDGKQVFSIAQHHFGRLPGFDFANGVLISPKDYATASIAETGLRCLTDS